MLRADVAALMLPSRFVTPFRAYAMRYADAAAPLLAPAIRTYALIIQATLFYCLRRWYAFLLLILDTRHA